MVIRLEDQTGAFVSFEHAMAQRRMHRQSRVIGYGVQSGGNIFCCASCVRHPGYGAMHA